MQTITPRGTPRPIPTLAEAVRPDDTGEVVAEGVAEDSLEGFGPTELLPVLVGRLVLVTLVED